VKLPEVEITTELLNNKMGQSINSIIYRLIQRRKENNIWHTTDWGKEIISAVGSCS